MRLHTESFSREKVDLDNPETYKHLPNTIKELDKMMFREIGYSICYMDYWHKDVFKLERREPVLDDWTDEEISQGYPEGMANSGFNQRQRVYKLIENFTKNRKEKWDDIMWFKEQVFLLDDETENMC